MTQNPESTHPGGGGAAGAKDAAQQEAQQLKDTAAHAAKDVAGTARREAANVKDEAVGQAKSMVSSLKDEASSQASTQQQRLAEQSRNISDDLRRVAQGEKPESDLVNRVVSTVADRAERFTTQLENKEPADLLQDVRRFAARRPGTFLAIAAGVGLLAGRLTRGLKDAADDGAGTNGADLRRSAPTAPRPPAPPVPPAPPTSAPVVTTPVDRVPGTIYPAGDTSLTEPGGRA
ncbi:hypothetical protein GCM10011512_05910 [Tersicoccus solisilvae]|uniref:DUF3618 domain-containing protein n=1 Tax=Tersicoccus solisilvae TaxID=1882339 RepID=A0ABQ1NP39_9MICC|nr:hypothetical protein [Tersicoccus solisilvae]GGC81973.1 hypothetical protein GCM10011512_05910 [Tersicoccus solisilvae]